MNVLDAGVERVEGNPSRIDLAVLVMFYARPQPLAKVFERLREVRPSRLYLHQDGPKSGRESDQEKILQCREVVGRIDWDCEVHRLYRETNIGCGPAQYMAEQWMFTHEEAGVILEDDVLPSASFFRFCYELLDRYKDDERIDRICGMNNLGLNSRSSASYFYSQVGSITGWASWRRVVSSWDAEYSWLDDESALDVLRGCFRYESGYRAFLARARRHRETGLPYHESAGGFSMLSQNRLLVVPTRNLVTYIGVTEGATNSPADVRLLPRRTRRMLTLVGGETEFPLRHPSHVVRDYAYERELQNSRIQEFREIAERRLLRLRYGGLRWLLSVIKAALQAVRGWRV